ncbi:hypothetical protein D6783_02970 [Candidatus Woesearchaeota archaeon]|nr:MAG: hypothetical protein D6783_02970 [Candidatus Woesearchaeota archaeon]
MILFFYILLLPAEDRNVLLNDGPTFVPGAPYQGHALFAKQVGLVVPGGEDAIKHALPPVPLFTRKDAQELLRVANVAVTRSFLTNRKATFRFNAPPGTTDPVFLSFNVEEGHGKLGIALNGETIYLDNTPPGSPPPITLPSTTLRTGDNNITFFTDSPNPYFWSRHAYTLRNVVIAADVVDKSSTVAEQHFSLSRDELGNTQSATLELFPTCDQPVFLSISINGGLLFSSFVECNTLLTLEVSPQWLRPGDNTVQYLIENGAVYIDQARINTIPRKASPSLFYFNIPPAAYNDLVSGNAQAILTISFAEFGKRKVGTINLNGYLETFDTTDVAYQTPISARFLKPAGNTIHFLAQDPFIIREARIDLI